MSSRPDGGPPTPADVLAFELSWYGSGGGPGATIEESFGVSPTAFFEHVLGVLENPPSPIAPRTARMMRSVARRRL